MCEEYSSRMNVVHWQLNLDPEFSTANFESAAFALKANLDLGGESPFLVANGRNDDSSIHRFWIIDPRKGTIENYFDLPGGPDLNGDGYWDGGYSVTGVLDIPTETGPQKALIIVCNVGFDLERRGIYAVDPWTGKIIWDFQSGSAPFYFGCQIVDLDGDGQQEVLMPARAPNNLHGRKVNGFSDDRPYLFVFEADGTLRWHLELGTTPGAPYLNTGDLDGDGSIEIVLAVHNVSDKGGSVQILNREGKQLASLTRNNHMLGCCLVPGKTENHLDIITGNRYSAIYRLSFENGKIAIVQEAANKKGLSILGLIEIPAEHNGPGIITLDQAGQGRILDQDFNIIASYKDDEGRFIRQLVTGPKSGKPSFILLGSKYGSRTLTYSPRTLAETITQFLSTPRLLLLSGLGLGLILAWLIWRVSRGRGDSSSEPELQETNDPLHLKERRLHLLEDLEISNHGAIAPLRSLRRLLWMLDAVQSGVGVNPNLVARMKEIWQDCHEDALPRLVNILERARLSQISDSVVDESLAAICRINAALNDLNSENFTADAVNTHLADLHKEEKATEALLQSLRRQVSEFFHTPLSAVLEKVLRANHRIIEENGVTVQTGMISAMQAGGAETTTAPTKSPICRMDADELSFILDNLVGNACRSMASAPRRNLVITWQPVNGMIKIEVADTGIGIATEDHQRVLEPGFSARPGGGLGLPKSQRLLKKYDGHLSIKRSKPGQGTTLLLVVPQA